MNMPLFSVEEEAKRLAALQSYEILDSLPEQDYEDITQLAAQICGTPIALISLVDSERQWFKAKAGLSFRETLRKQSFCAHNLVSPTQPFLVEDARRDKRFYDNPLVTDDPHIVFYAGQPLIDEDGITLGSLCVMDSQVHQLNQGQLNALRILANQVITLLTARRKAIQAAQLQLQLQQSEGLFQSLFKQSATAMLLLVGRELIIQDANSLMLNYMRKDQSVIGQSLRAVLPELKDQAFFDILDQVYTTGVGYEGRNLVATVDQEGQPQTGYYDLSYQPIRNAQGEVFAILEVAVEVTQRQLAQDALRASEAQLSTVFEVMPAGLAIADANGKILRFNPALNRIWGIPPIPDSTADYAQWKARWADTGQLLAAQDWAMARALRTGKIVPGDIVEIERFDGGRAIILNAAAPILDVAGTIVGGRRSRD